MYVEQFAGNFSQINAIMYWLNRFYGGDCDNSYWFDEFIDGPKSNKFILIIADSGNGKTYLPELISKDFKIELLHITPFDINNGDDLNNFIKSINMMTLDGKEKLVLIDDIDEYYSTYKNKLISIKEHSRFPIIYTSKTPIKISEVDTEKQKRNKNLKNFTYLKDGIIVRIHKPTPSEIKSLLEKKSIKDVPYDIVEKISQESKSVRSAINSLQNYSVNKLVEPYKTIRDLVNDVKKRDLKEPMDDSLLKVVFDSVQGFDEDSMKVMLRLSDYDYQINRCWMHTGQKPIHPFIVNHMKEPIEKVLSYRYKPKIEDENKVYAKSKKLPVGFIKEDRYVTYRNEKDHFFRKFRGLGISISVLDEISDKVDNVEFVFTKDNGKKENYLVSIEDIREKGNRWINDKDPYEQFDEQLIMRLDSMKRIDGKEEKKSPALATFDKWGI